MGEAGAPLGRLPTPKQLNLPTVKHPDVFIRMLVCLELPHARFADLPFSLQHAELMAMVVQHRHGVSESSAAQPALITPMKRTRDGSGMS